MTIKSVHIGGLDRSGKTYMRFILEGHPDFIFSKRTSMWSKYYKKYGPLEKHENLDQLMSAMAKNKHINALSLDFEQLREEFKPGAPTYERIFELIQHQNAEKNGKIIWGDQSEALENHAEIILNAYPDAKFIHMIRDPRDRFAAILKKQSGRWQGLGIATARWLKSARLAVRNKLAYPDRYMVIRYETMVSDLENTTKKVCDFLDVKYDPSMLLLGHVTRYKNQGSSENKFNSPISNKYVGQYKCELSPSQIVFIEKFTHINMKELNYQLNEDQNVVGYSLIDYLKTWPLNVLQMAGWNLVTQEGRV